MKITRLITINAPADKVWKVFAHDFDSASEWMASVPHSYGEKTGKKFEGAKSAGRVCELDDSPNGIKASESFLNYNEENKTCVVEIRLLNTPFMVPIHTNVLTFSVKDNEANQSIVSWVVVPKFKSFGFLLYPLVKFALGMFMGQITQELKYFVENGTPHPRKLKANKKLKLVANG